MSAVAHAGATAQPAAHVGDGPVYTAPAAHAFAIAPASHYIPLAPAGHGFVAPANESSSGIGTHVDHGA